MTEPVPTEQSVSTEHMRALAEVANLPLPEDRLAAAAALLSAWLPAANELSVAMSQAEHLHLGPITVVTQPHSTDGQE